MPKGNIPSQGDEGKQLIENMVEPGPIRDTRSIPRPPKPPKPAKPTFQHPINLNPRVIPRSNMEQWMYNTISQRQLGYTPTVGQDPRAIARAHQLIKATPGNLPLPDWIANQKDSIEAAYKWHQWKNRF